MNTQKLFMIIMLLVITIVLLVTIMQMYATPMLRPTNMVRSYILSDTPIGMNIEDVIEIINSRDDWKDLPLNVNRDFGFNPQSPWSEVEFPHFPRIGEQFVLMPLGRYRVWHSWPPFVDVNVSVAWIFDSDGELIDIYIRKLGMF